MTTAHHHEQDDVTVREIPKLRYRAIGWVVLALFLATMAAWELKMRSLGLRPGDLDDGASHWAVERRKLAAGDHDGVVIFGSSRILFDTDLDAWEELTGRRPIQLALPGTSPRSFLARFAQETDFAGLVVVGITPELYFADFVSAFPEFATLQDNWQNESPSTRSGHRLGLWLSERFAFLEDQYTLTKLIEQVDIPNRQGVRGPYLEVWKLSETFAGRQTRMWPRVETDEFLQDHAKRVWMSRDRGALPPDIIEQAIEESRTAVNKIRARGGDVVFIRAPSVGAYHEREQRNAPRAVTWDRLLRETGAVGIHFEDHPEMQGLELPEFSHLTRESATRFTRAYVELLRERYVWLRPGAVLHPGT
jgi:hypothetical protein